MSEAKATSDATPFDEAAFDADFDAAASRCQQLTHAEARQFVEKGYVVAKAAFSPASAGAVREQAWAELEAGHGVKRHRPDSWNRSAGFGPRAYFRTRGSGARFQLKVDAPRAFESQAELVGGKERLRDGDELAWSDAAIANLGVAGDRSWQPPHPRQRGWHKDGWHFRHFLNSPEQGLLAVPLFSDILPRSGGTFIATDSIRPVAQLLAAHPEGIHADSVQGGGYLIPGLIEQCSRFEELTGAAGDLAILHPYMLHRVCPNPSPRPRFIANVAVVLREPMRFDRPPDEPCSLVELTVLRALGINRLDYQATRPKQAVVPGPFRNEDQAARQRALLAQEMRAMASRGVVTPSWGQALGYMSNRAEKP